MPPGWLPPSMQSSCKLRRQEVDLSSRFDPSIPTNRKIYTFIQFVITVIFSLYLLINSPSIPYTTTAIVVLFLTYCFYVHGAWLEARNSALRLELIRLALLVIVVQLLEPNLITNSSLIIYALLSIAIVTFFSNKKLMSRPSDPLISGDG